MNAKTFFTNIYVRNILGALLVIVLLVFLTLRWLDTYTRHGESIEIPNVKGLTIEKAEPFFQASRLNYQVVDSVFNRDAEPGTIVETIPPMGTKVKEGRIIFITLNSFSSQLLVIPDVKDYSQRQAVAILKSVGFENIEILLIPGPYRDLVLGLESHGQPMEPGQRVSVTTPLVLLVSSGKEEILLPEDSVTIDTTLEESWF